MILFQLNHDRFYPDNNNYFLLKSEKKNIHINLTTISHIDNNYEDYHNLLLLLLNHRYHVQLL
jgi:hypothetical protein